MKLQANFAYFILIILFCNPTWGFAGAPPATAEQLRSDLEIALKDKDTNAVMSLFNWEGGSNDWRESAGMREMMIRLQTDDMLNTDITDVALVPLPANFQATQTNEQSGICQELNVNAIGLIEVKSSNGKVGKLPYGKKENAFYIAGVVLRKLPGRLLCVQVSAGPNPDLFPYTGSWVYVRNGKEITVDTSDKTNRFKTYWGDYIKSCTIKRTSTNSLATPGFASWFYFDVLEGGKKVYESPQITNEKPVTYERNMPIPH